MQFRFIGVVNSTDGRIMTIQRRKDSGATWEEFGVPIVRPDAMELFANEIICRFVAGETVPNLKSIVRTIPDNF